MAETAEASRRWNEVASAKITMRTHAEILSFFNGLDLLEPGLVQLHHWRPDHSGKHSATTIPLYGGAGRKP
jgi:hypothetical protein